MVKSVLWAKLTGWRYLHRHPETGPHQPGSLVLLLPLPKIWVEPMISARRELSITHRNIGQELCHLLDIFGQEGVQHLHVRLLVPEHHIVREVLDDLRDQE